MKMKHVKFDGPLHKAKQLRLLERLIRVLPAHTNILSIEEYTSEGIKFYTCNGHFRISYAPDDSILVCLKDPDRQEVYLGYLAGAVLLGELLNNQ